MSYFEYMNEREKRKIGRFLGEYVSREIIKHRKTSIDDLNSLDRLSAANKWYEKESSYHKNEINEIIKKYDINLENFLDEVAIWIDERIPKAYKKWFYNDCDNSPASTEISKEEVENLGLKYHFQCNINKEKSEPFIAKITDRQLSYLTSLSCNNNFHMINKDMTLKEASEYIDYFLNIDYYEKPENFDKHFRKGL